MKKEKQTMFGVEFQLSVPSTVEEFNAALKTAGSTLTVLDYANAEAYYRGLARKIREPFVKKIEELTGVSPRVIRTEGEGENAKKVYEKDTEYFKYALAESSKTPADFVAALQAIADEVGWDLSATRSSRGATKVDRDNAAYILKAIEAGQSTYERVKTNLESSNPGLVVPLQDDGSIAEADLALACRVERERRENESRASVL